MVWIECDDAFFSTPFQESSPEIVLSRKKLFCKNGVKLNYRGYSQVSLLTYVLLKDS